MAFTFEDIYGMLKNGESSEDIVKEFTTYINSAEEQIAQEKAAEAEKSVSNEVRCEKAGAIIDAIADYYMTVYPDATVDIEASNEDVANLLDWCATFRKSLSEFEKRSKDKWASAGDGFENMVDRMTDWLSSWF